jgi:SpoVK/Ycf46/Vps4 family AAA+-type ATPase
VAGLFGVPLLRLDIGALYNKFIGETERQLRESLALADMMAPCVLWIDEIEKGLSREGDTDGVGKRVLGTLLTWMAERRSRVFLVATSNDITDLPPELIRKGRMDEIFFVDLPGVNVRQDILAIHLRKRGQDPSTFDLAALAEATEGYGGAEIEQVVVAALYAASADKTRLETSHLQAQVAATVPLSVLMAEQIQGLRDWARDRTVKADPEPVT